MGQPLQGVDALRAKRSEHMRHAPTLAETRALLQTVQDVSGYPPNLITRLLYGCGLRVTEPLNLRIKDVNFEKFRLCIRGAKGGKDRMISMPPSLAPELIQQMEFAKAVWRQDQHNGIPVTLPYQLARKYPEYRFAWPWAWLFPARQICFDRRNREAFW